MGPIFYNEQSMMGINVLNLIKILAVSRKEINHAHKGPQRLAN
jgi:hypothetical protein